MLRYAIGAAAFALAVGSVDPAAAQRVKAGLLTCDVSAGIGFIIGSQKAVSCVYAPEPAGPQQVYSGSISKFGLDIGVTSSGVMVWGVFTDSVGPNPGFLAGDYFGASGEVTIAAGLGANVLVGGSNRTVALQPVSVDSSVGLNLAVGVAELRLRPAPERAALFRSFERPPRRGRPFSCGRLPPVCQRVPCPCLRRARLLPNPPPA